MLSEQFIGLMLIGLAASVTLLFLYNVPAYW